MENKTELGMSLGVKFGNSHYWYRIHSLNRCPNGVMVAYALDDARTAFVIPAAKFAGTSCTVEEHGGMLRPDILEIEQMQQFKVQP